MWLVVGPSVVEEAVVRVVGASEVVVDVVVGAVVGCGVFSVVDVVVSLVVVVVGCCSVVVGGRLDGVEVVVCDSLVVVVSEVVG